MFKDIPYAHLLVWRKKFTIFSQIFVDFSQQFRNPGFGFSEITDNCLNFEQDAKLALEEAIQHLEGAF